MKQTNLTIIGYSNGKYKIIPIWKRRLICGLKRAGVILGALLVAVLCCGAAITSERPAKIVQMVFIFCTSVFVLVAAIVLSVPVGGAKKYKDNRKISRRR